MRLRHRVFVERAGLTSAPGSVTRSLRTALLAATVLLADQRLAAAGAVDSPVYDVAVQWVQVTGNAFGSPGFFDDFNSSDGLTRPWVNYFGTASEHDGALHLTSPGSLYPYPPYPDVTLVQSAVLGPTTHNGSGDFVGQSAWDADVPALNNYQFFAVGNGLSLDTQEAVAIGAWNLDAATAAAFEEDGAGFAIVQTHVHIDSGEFVTNDREVLWLDPS